MTLVHPPKRLEHDGRLFLDFEKRRHKTVLTNCYQSPPLKASRELYLNQGNPNEATVYLMQSSGGLVAGDQNEFKIDVSEGADVCLIPQSATLIYPSYTGFWSSQNVEVTIGPKASLAWKTEAVIPFRKAKFCGETKVQMAPDAKLLWGEILSPGRDKRDEKFQYNEVKNKFQVWMDEDCLIYDTLVFSPEQTDLKQLGLLEDHLYVGSLWFVAPTLQQIDMKELNEQLQQATQLKVGASMIEGKAINIRWLASDIVLLKKEMDKIWQTFSTANL